MQYIIAVVVNFNVFAALMINALWNNIDEDVVCQ